MLHKKFQNDPLLGKVLRTLSEWKLSPYQLMLEFGKDLSRLKDPSMQALFYRLFFRSPVDETGKAELGTGQLIVEDEALFENCKSFIHVGLNHFDNLDKSIEGSRFFFEMAFYLSKYLSDAGQKNKAEALNQIEAINRWLKKDELKEKDRAILHLYRVLFYSVKPREDLNEQDLAAIYQSWITYHFYPEDGTWKSPMALELANNFMTTLTTKLKDPLGKADGGFRNKLCTNILLALELDNCEGAMNWKEDPDLGAPIYKVQRGEDNFWQLDLACGKIYSQSGIIGGVCADLPWESQEDFKRIFSGRTGFSYRSLGGENVTFTDPKLGSFRLIASGYYSYRVYHIQRQFPGSKKWFEYASFNEEEGFPTILHSDHTHWVPVGGCIYSPDGERINGYIATLKDHRRKFATTSQGCIIEVDSQTGLPGKESRQVDFLDSSELVSLRGFLNFERQDRILSYSNAGGRIQKLQLPRYTSQEGNPLVFTLHHGKLIWTDNRQYALPAEMPKGYLGTIENYLYLEPIEGKGPAKLLVPFQYIDAGNNTPIPHGVLTRDNVEPLMPPKKEQAPVEQWQLFRYFSFNVEQGQVKAITLEGQLFLAYIHFSQKGYSEAIELIRKIKPTETVSPMGMKILQLIQDHPLGEDHPEARMVHLQSLLLSMKEKDKASSKPVENYFAESELKKLWNSMVYVTECLQSLNNISLNCRMSAEDEARLIDNLLKEGNRKRAAMEEKLKIKNFESVKLQMEHRREFLRKHKEESVGTKNLSIGERQFPKKGTKGRYRSRLDTHIWFDLPARPNEPDRYSYTYYSKRYPKSYEEVRLEYERNMRKYRLDLERKVQWLEEGELCTQYTRHKKEFKFERNGKLLLEVCRIAKKGSPEARKDMLWRLLQWRMHTHERRTNFLDHMIAILWKPQLFPDPIDVRIASDEEKAAFLKKLNNGTYRFYKEKSVDSALREVFNVGSQPAIDRTRPGSKTDYPIPSSSAFDSKEREVDVFGDQKKPVGVTLDPNESRWSLLQTWKRDYLTLDATVHPEVYDDFDLRFDDSLISREEEDYRESIKQDLFLLQQDY
ncbi:MAG: hypothetical protein ACE5GN_03590, partial [Waddliaceae bacterium]